VRALEAQGLLLRVRRYLIRPKAQISNLYNLHNLVVVIARYLAEHGQAFYEKWLLPFLTMPARRFWVEAVWLEQTELSSPFL
jgi:hypothetical protein